MSIEPDRKDWTWVLERPCPQCAIEAGTIEPERIASLIRANARGWVSVFGRTEADWQHERPDLGTWSPLEYAAHVRDVHHIFAERLQSTLEEDDPLWPDWDQDAAAVERDYPAEDPVEVIAQLEENAERVAGAYAVLNDAQWRRPGRRSDGAAFTTTTLAQYHLHDVVHHLHDIHPDRPEATGVPSQGSSAPSPS